MKISTILDQIDMGSLALPEFQRGYVWNRDQVRELMNSMYKRFPVGSLLVWETKRDKAATRGDSKTTDTIKLLLDGQQRATSLYGIIRGKAPDFFDGDPKAFTDLYFNIEEEVFEFYGPMKMKDNPYWIDVTKLMQEGVGTFMRVIYQNDNMEPKAPKYLERLNKIHQIKEINLHIAEITGEDKDTETVVEIFNIVNSGGTKLSKGDLALAKVCASWPKARDELQERLHKWENAGFSFKMDWLLRCINTITTGEAKFKAMDNLTIAEFKDGMNKAEKGIDRMLNIIGSRLGLDHDRVLGSVYSFPLMVRFLNERGMQFRNHQERDRMLYWYIHTFLWGRYAGSTESKLNQDLACIEDIDQGIDRLIEMLRQNRGDLKLYPSDFQGWSRGARFYPMLYMLTRVWKARDWESGIELSKHLLGNLSGLQLHHIFPKAYLYDSDYSKSQVNALANMTFLTQETNLHISNRPPVEYLTEIEEKQPGVLESHWVPMNRELWKRENYLDFLVVRQKLLAKAANEFLDSLKEGRMTEQKVVEQQYEKQEYSYREMIDSISSPEEEQELLDLRQWLKEQNLPEGELGYEVLDSNDEPITYFDLAWPNGLQRHLSQPVTLLLNEDDSTTNLANRAGFRYFTTIPEFKNYVLKEIVAEQTAA